MHTRDRMQEALQPALQFARQAHRTTCLSSVGHRRAPAFAEFFGNDSCSLTATNTHVGNASTSVILPLSTNPSLLAELPSIRSTPSSTKISLSVDSKTLRL